MLKHSTYVHCERPNCVEIKNEKINRWKHFGPKLRLNNFVEKDVKVGDHVGVGYFIDSCLNCKYCHNGEENNCENGITRTSCGFIKHGRVKNDNKRFSYGG